MAKPYRLASVRLQLDLNVVLAEYLQAIGEPGMMGNTLEAVAERLIVESVQRRLEAKEIGRRKATPNGKSVVIL